MFQLPQVCLFKTEMNKSPIHCLRSGKGFFRLISLVSLCFTVIHDCLFCPQLFSSVEFGRRWLLLHEGVTPNRFYW